MSVNSRSLLGLTKTSPYGASPTKTRHFKVMKNTSSTPSLTQDNIARIPPPTFSKYFKTTIAAQKLMDPEGRLCELDRSNAHRVLVYSKYPGDVDWDEMSWSQASLFKRAQEDPTLRISRKKPYGMDEFAIRQRDFFNEPELTEYADKPSMNLTVTSIKLGFLQARRDWIYLLSKKTGEKKDTTESVSGGK